MKVVTTVAAVLVAVIGVGAARGEEETRERAPGVAPVASEQPPGGMTPAGAVHVHVRCRCPRPTRAQLLELLRAARARQVAALRAYLEVGRFPAEVLIGGRPLVELEEEEEALAHPRLGRVARFGDQDPHAAEGRQHTFIGANGALCAVAHLIAADGQRPLVDRVAKERNGLCTATTTDAEVLAWIRGSGLTREEVVRIQEPGFTGRLQRLVDPGAEIAGHLTQVLAELEADAEASLATAVERWLASGALPGPRSASGAVQGRGPEDAS